MIRVKITVLPLLLQLHAEPFSYKLNLWFHPGHGEQSPVDVACTEQTNKIIEVTDFIVGISDRRKLSKISV